MKINLHIGTVKTGTTSIQTSLAANREMLGGQGILYPASLKLPNNTALATAFQAPEKMDDLRKKAGVAGEVAVLQYRETLRKELENEISRAGCRRLLISSEHLSSRLDRPGEIEVLHTFLLAISNEIDIYIYLRPQDALYISLYSTAVRSGGVLPFAFPDAAEVRHDLLYDELLEKWAAVFGRERIHVRTYDEAVSARGDIVADFWEWLGLPFEHRSEVADANRALDVKQLEFMRRFNRSVPRFIGDQPNPLVGDFVRLMEQMPSDGDALHIDDEQRQAFLAQFDERNRRVAEAYFGRPSLFFAQASEEALGTGMMLGTDDSVRFAAELWKAKQRQINRLHEQIRGLEKANRHLKRALERFERSTDPDKEAAHICLLPSDDFFNTPDERVPVRADAAPLLVYQVGKVGSSAIFAGLKQALPDVPVYQVHHIARAESLLARERARGFKDAEHHLVTGLRLKKCIESCPELRWKVVVGVREPVRRWVSDVFQNLRERYAFLLDERGEPALDKTVAFVRESLLKEPQQRWFKDELEATFGIDVCSVPIEKGYTVIEGKNVSCLVYKYEALGEELEAEIARFSGVQTFRLVKANQTEDTPFASAYKKVLERLRLEESVLRRLYENGAAGRCYTQCEREGFIRHWSRAV